LFFPCIWILTLLQIASADIADVIIQSFSKSGVSVLVGLAMAIICITALNLTCKHVAQLHHCSWMSFIFDFLHVAVVFWQIKTDNLDHIWPIRMLRVIIIITITTLFPTFLDLCLKPLRVSCLASSSLRFTSAYALGAQFDTCSADPHAVHILV
jgi:hypothetical protein